MQRCLISGIGLDIQFGDEPVRVSFKLLFIKQKPGAADAGEIAKADIVMNVHIREQSLDDGLFLYDGNFILVIWVQ